MIYRFFKLATSGGSFLFAGTSAYPGREAPLPCLLWVSIIHLLPSVHWRPDSVGFLILPDRITDLPEAAT